MLLETLLEMKMVMRGGGDENINNVFSDYILPDKIGPFFKNDDTIMIKMYKNITEYLYDPEAPGEGAFACLYKKEHLDITKCLFMFHITDNVLHITHCDDSGRYMFSLCERIINNSDDEVYYEIMYYK